MVRSSQGHSKVKSSQNGMSTLVNVPCHLGWASCCGQKCSRPTWVLLNAILVVLKHFAEVTLFFSQVSLSHDWDGLEPSKHDKYCRSGNFRVFRIREFFGSATIIIISRDSWIREFVLFAKFAKIKTCKYYQIYSISDVVSMLAHHLRRWTNGMSTLVNVPCHLGWAYCCGQKTRDA